MKLRSKKCTNVTKNINFMALSEDETIGGPEKEYRKNYVI